ncbi:hypothetical protein JKF63_01843 [Porcisia hertigi]|uniref:Uncharacterized protein n=1 Tax=Porcisia hertigi TaxID=2761500 RepID=A0A836I053_9TRYP|nr:hypothetical protein JKF63_01843 [Porcisia hertigi]
MNPDEGSETVSVTEPLPQEQITMLLNVQDFQEKVAQDSVNLCCVMVTSTLCRHCGIRNIQYPKVDGLNARATGDGNGESEDEDAGEGGDDGYDDDDSQANGSAARLAGTGHFYRDIELHLVQNRDTAQQRRHTRFFHVCACAEEETCIDFLIAADPAYSVLNKQPTAQETALLHKKSYQQLKELLNLLDVRSTPLMRFYLAGQPLRYTAMSSSGTDGSVPEGVTAETDVLQVSGANWIKWTQVLQNAVAVRNHVMQAYDAEERAKARAARAAARRLARLERKRQAAAEEEEEDEEGDEDD